MKHRIPQAIAVAYVLTACQSWTVPVRWAPVWRGAALALAAPEQSDAAAKPAAEEEEEPPLQTPPKAATGKPAEKPASNTNVSEEPTVPAADDGETTTGGSPAAAEEPVCDIVTFEDKQGEERTFRAALSSDWRQPPLPANEKFVFRYYAGNNTTNSAQTFFGRQIRRIDYYETRMLRLAAVRARVSYETLIAPGRAIDLSAIAQPESDRLEQLLTTAVAEHESAVQQNLRRGPAWAKQVGLPLANALFNFRLGQIDLLASESELEQAQRLCDRLFGELHGVGDPRRGALRRRFEAVWLKPAEEALGRGDLAEARSSLKAITDRFPEEPGAATAALDRRLDSEAAALLAKAEEKADSDRLSAMQLLDQAAAAAPELPQIDQFRQRLGLGYSTLECAYPELPATLNPLLAISPSERHASSLLFERLAYWRNRSQTGPHYALQLAEECESLARGRQFHLPHAPPARWSDYRDDAPFVCTAADVSWTVKLLGDKSRPGYWGALSRLLAVAEPGAADNAFVVNLRLSRDVWQPVSLMQFPVLPKHRFPAGGSQQEWEAFGAAPVGTGPYRLEERDASRLRFAANPYYRLAGLPKIREINFRRLNGDELIQQIQQRRVQLAYGLTTAQVEKLTELNKPIRALQPRSVWFLAPNYRRPALANQDLRLALAHAIDRDGILNGVFRPRGRTGDHAALNGPFPPHSWAANPATMAFSPELARPFAANALRALGKLPTLSLAYCAAEPDAGRACRQIQTQAAAIGIEIAPAEVEADEFADRVLKRHDFDLVYWRHDYTDETYSLGALFDPDPAARESGGANFMGAVPDAAMSGFFRELTLHKRFSDIQAQMQKLHDHVARTAAIIPLWRLDAYIAVDEALAGVELDPDELFIDVERWELKAP